MGQYEVLEWLRLRRESGDVSFRSYTQVHQCMRREGRVLSYGSVWWSITCLFNQGRLEARALGGVLQRRWVFRYKIETVVQGSDMKRVHNTYHQIDEKSFAEPARESGAPARVSARGGEDRQRGKRRRITW